MGTSIGVLYDRWAVGDHPHAYGDKTTQSQENQQTLGSSPRVWGQVELIDELGELERIIPTRMGTSLFQSNTLTEDKDHPHAYGDKSMVYSLKSYHNISSPRVWGQVKVFD